MKQLIVLIFAICVFNLNAQKKETEHIMTLDEQVNSPKATLTDVSWISGNWKGKAFGGIVEENWSEPSGDSMMATFKLISDGKVSFYEIEIIREVNESLILQLKHFNGDLTGWETKDETIVLKITEAQSIVDGFDVEYILAAIF